MGGSSVVGTWWVGRSVGRIATGTRTNTLAIGKSFRCVCAGVPARLVMSFLKEISAMGRFCFVHLVDGGRTSDRQNYI